MSSRRMCRSICATLQMMRTQLTLSDKFPFVYARGRAAGAWTPSR